MNLSSYNNLLQGVQQDDPRLYELLKQLGAEVIRHQLELYPQEEIGLLPPDETGFLPPQIGSFNYELFPDNVLLSWTLIWGRAARYEIRAGGTNWENSNVVIQTDTSSARIEPLAVGTHRYWIKAIGEDGEYSTEPATFFVDILIPPIATFSLSASAIDNNVLLGWTPPRSVFRINYFIVRKNGEEIGLIRSTFVVVFENVAGIYEYSVQPVDIYGNLGPEIFVYANITQPPDYELRADFLSSLNGTKVNVTLIPGPRLLCNTYPTETWQTHFTSRGWANIQEQLNAGYPLYIQPSNNTGSYVETIDYGLIVTSTVITITFNTILVAPVGVNVQCDIETSIDGVLWTPKVTATTMFVASLRYARITFTFTSPDATSLIEFFNFRARLDVKKVVDSGDANVLESDGDGTIVYFNRPFKDIESIVCTVQETTGFITVVDFVDVPNPTQFKIFVFTTAGARVSKLVRWVARGIV